jgi:hypothetical protein
MNSTHPYVTMLMANADRIFSVSLANFANPAGEYESFMVTSVLDYLDAKPALDIEASITDGLAENEFSSLAEVNAFIERHGGPRFEIDAISVHGVGTDAPGFLHRGALNAAIIIQSRLAGKIYQGLVFEKGLGEWLPDTGNDYDVVRSPGNVPIHTELTHPVSGSPMTRGDIKDIWLRALADFGEGGV